MVTRTAVAAAAPAWVRDRLAGPVVQARVVHVGAHALYVAAADGECIGVLARAASAVPCGLHTMLPSLHELLHSGQLPSRSEPVEVGEGRLSVGDTDVRVGRLVNHAVPRFRPPAAAGMARHLRATVRGGLADVLADVPPTALAMLDSGDSRAVAALLGRGSGLTPVGDDVLAGWLATMAGAGQPGSGVARAVAASAATTTTLLSASLLERAAAGEVLPELRHLMLSLRNAADAPSEGLVHDVLAIGHTSGAGILLGCLSALDHLASRSARS